MVFICKEKFALHWIKVNLTDKSWDKFPKVKIKDEKLIKNEEKKCHILSKDLKYSHKLPNVATRCQKWPNFSNSAKNCQM